MPRCFIERFSRFFIHSAEFRIASIFVSAIAQSSTRVHESLSFTRAHAYNALVYIVCACAVGHRPTFAFVYDGEDTG